MQQFTLKEIAEALGARLKGDPGCVITGIAPIQKAKAGDICFLNNLYYREFLKDSQASAVVLSPENAEFCSTNALITENPYLGFAKMAHLFYQRPSIPAGVHPTAVIATSAHIDPSASIGAYCVIGNYVTIGANSIVRAHTILGDEVKIGNDCYLYENVTIYHRVTVGHRVTLHSGVIIGADGFGLAKDDKHQWVKIPQVGGVTIGNDVEVGANTCIDRGALEDTLIEEGVKLDNLIQVGHNVRIGAHTAIAGCVAIAGSANIGRYCMIGGAASINGHISIADRTMIGATASVANTIKQPGAYSSGVPAQPHKKWRRILGRLMQLEDIMRRLRKLERLNA
ncbi:MAG TPA: UDP-3-O-(3-hydroxymyristoyl)glucosamine N-acyltransferase [Coxiellaceae bacterium]|nr:UDP-3-O-(3-hydroxymyristoyl)glucosamine N-acyltransferase [Coxiellaceae bacterium]